MSRIKSLIGILVLLTAVLMYGCAPETPITPEPQENMTTEPTAEFGDLVTINFNIYLENGTLVDTNDPELAQENGIKNYVKGPYTFVLGQSGKMPGYDEKLIGMKIGATREATIEPSEPELILAIENEKIIERFITLPKLQRIPIKQYTEIFGREPYKGAVVFDKRLVFKYKVINMTEKTVLAEIIAKEGEKYRLMSTEWDSKVAKTTEKDIMFYQMPKENQTVDAPFGTGKISLSGSRIIITFEPELNKLFNRSVELSEGFSLPQEFKVIEIREKDFIIKRHGLLTDKRLKLEAELLEIVKNVKEVRKNKKILTETVTA